MKINKQNLGWIISVILIILTAILLIGFVSAETTFYEGREFIYGINPEEQTDGGGGGGGWGGETCNPLWVCEEWSSCHGGVRSRMCVDINYCNSNQRPPLLFSCLKQLPSDRIIGCVDFVALDGVITRWKLDIFRFDILNEAIYKWKNTNC